MNAKQLSMWISDVLESQGFARGKHGWYRPAAECLAMVSLDKSPYGGQYYITLAASPRELLDAAHPPEHKLHVRVRLESLVTASSEMSSALDLENASVPTDDRKRVIQEALKVEALPLLALLSSLKGMTEALSNHPRAASFMVRTTLREHLTRS